MNTSLIAASVLSLGFMIAPALAHAQFNPQTINPSIITSTNPSPLTTIAIPAHAPAAIVPTTPIPAATPSVATRASSTVQQVAPTTNVATLTTQAPFGPATPSSTTLATQYAPANTPTITGTSNAPVVTTPSSTSRSGSTSGYRPRASAQPSSTHDEIVAERQQAYAPLMASTYTVPAYQPVTVTTDASADAELTEVIADNENDMRSNAGASIFGLDIQIPGALAILLAIAGILAALVAGKEYQNRQKQAQPEHPTRHAHAG